MTQKVGIFECSNNHITTKIKLTNLIFALWKLVVEFI
jgi:hypothetical protein